MKMCMLGLGIALVVAGCQVQGCSGGKNTSENEGRDAEADTHVDDTAGKILVSSIEAKGILTLIPRRNADSRLAASAPQFTVTSYTDSSIGLFFTLSGGGYDLRSVKATLYGSEGDRLATAQTTDISTSGTMNRETGTPSVTTYGHVMLDPVPAPHAAGTRVVIEFLTATEEAVWTIHLDSARAGDRTDRHAVGILEFTLVTERSAMGIVFQLMVRRTGAGRPSEYMPTSERCRFQVYDPHGAELWNSSANVMFAQVIGDVEPSAIGDTTRYRAIWDGINHTTSKPAEPGRYTVRATIPAKPVPYIHTEEFHYGDE